MRLLTSVELSYNHLTFHGILSYRFEAEGRWQVAAGNTREKEGGRLNACQHRSIAYGRSCYAGTAVVRLRLARNAIASELNDLAGALDSTVA